MIEILQGGPFSTIQDSGRKGYQHLGVPSSGALDEDALLLGNSLLGNPQDCAAIEICFGGFQARIETPTALCLTGSTTAQIRHHKPSGDVVELPCAKPLLFDIGDVIEIPPFGDTLSALLCLGGGVDVPPIYGSRATTINAKLGGLEGRLLRAGDKLSCGAFEPNLLSKTACAKHIYDAFFATQTRLRILAGPQDFWFTPDALTTLTSTSYQISGQTSRMGMRLIGAALPHKGPADIISDGMVRGAIQVPAQGQPIIAMADHGTMGGYTKIACVIAADLSALGRLRPNQFIQFEMVTEHEAHEALRQKTVQLQALLP